MTKTKLIGVLIALAFLAGCKEDVDVYDKYHNSVVMIYHKYVYKMEVEYGATLYFYYDENTGTIAGGYTELKEAEKEAMANYSTGFFIGTDGKIATNRHVVYNLNKNIEDKAKSYFQAITLMKKAYYDSLKNEAMYQRQIWTNTYNNSYWQEDKDKALKEITAWKEIQAAYAEQVTNWETMQSSLLPNAKLSVETIYLGYAVNGSFAKRITDFKECQLVKYSKEEDVDLAVIQANDRKLPEGVTNYVRLDDLSSEPLKVGDEVSMLGYNLGLDEISSTSEGLKVQNATGKISQESNGIRVLYEINALPGSSGSPVFSKDGKLIAINYYGYSTKAFTYGILARHLAALIQ